ncbi:hypothetical protein TNCV_2494091 [Trichonephila clavipes]|uniref:Uncharacterized protein n=1 Tax=Trichonephila clavipes TaxID=2585209 RepID=A0A8X6V9C7_TRICX|nr:hypothetical protein TNCV_2494091 [Trichonephila clavipes]
MCEITSMNIFLTDGLNESGLQRAIYPMVTRSPDLTLCNFFQRGYVKKSAFVPTLPVDLAELKQLATTTINELDPDILTRVWAKMYY